MSIRRRSRVAAASFAVAAAVCAWARPSRADLHEAARRVADAWRAAGAAVVVDQTRFLEDGETVPVVLPPMPEGDCTTVVLLGARGLGFHVTIGKVLVDDPAARLESEAGALSIERCGEELRGRLLVTTESGQGALETVVARSAHPLLALRAILPERSAGAVVLTNEPGALPPMPAPGHRADVAESRAKRDGAQIATRATWRAGGDGAGAGEQVLEAGCHTLHLFAVDPRAVNPSRRGKLDLDAEMRDSASDHILSRDRTDAPDAQLPVCLGETTAVQVAFVGAPPDSPVLVAHVAWPLPEHLPEVWGSEPRARMAHVLLTRHASPLPGEPVLLAQGGSGTTSVPVPVEPGACYVAVAVVVQGSARDVGVRVLVGLKDVYDDRGADENGAVVAFCAGQHYVVTTDVDARGTPLLGWGLALYRVGAGIWENPR